MLLWCGSIWGGEVGFRRAVDMGFEAGTRERARTVCSHVTFFGVVGGLTMGAIGRLNNFITTDQPEIRQADRDL